MSLKRLLRATVILILLAGVVILSAPLWLPSLGAALVRNEPLARADAIMVLAGGWAGNRVLKACEVARQGYAPVVIVNGGRDWYGNEEGKAAAQFAIAQGCPAHLLEPLALQASSTAEEASKARPILLQRGFKNIMVVTSDYHTRRAAFILERAFGRAIQVRMVAAPDPAFSADRWWRDRESRKTVFFEWSKTIAAWVGA